MLSSPIKENNKEENEDNALRSDSEEEDGDAEEKVSQHTVVWKLC